MSTPEELTEQQRIQWSSVACGWERWGDWFDRNSDNLSGWMCDQAGIKPGSRVLDLACGPGPTATTAAERVRPGGHVVATDLSADMVSVALRRKQRLGLDNLEILEMDMRALTLPDASFDAVTCRFGLMFCPDPVIGAAEALRVLRAGGRYAVAVWDLPAKNPFFTTLSGVISEFVPMPRPDPAVPGIFRLASPGDLERVLRTAGFSDITIESRRFDLKLASPDEYWQIQTAMAAPARAAVASLTPEQLATLKARLFNILEPYTVDGAITLTATPLCAVASKPE